MKKNYIVIHRGFVYKVDDVTYSSSETHRRFKRDDELVLSVPLNSTLLLNDGSVIWGSEDSVKPLTQAIKS